MKYAIVFLSLSQIVIATQTQPSLLERITVLQEDQRKAEQELSVCVSCASQRAREASDLLDKASKVIDEIVATLESPKANPSTTLSPAQLVNQEKLCQEKWDILEEKAHQMATRLSSIVLSRAKEIMMQQGNKPLKTVADLVREERAKCAEQVQKYTAAYNAKGKAIAKEFVKEDNNFIGIKNYLIDRC